jgi:membrane dipeptidase
VSTFPTVTQALLDRGYSDADIHKIMGENTLRVLREAGEVARNWQSAVKTRSGVGPNAK